MKILPLDAQPKELEITEPNQRHPSGGQLRGRNRRCQSERLPPAAAASIAEAAAFSSGNSPIANQSWRPKVKYQPISFCEMGGFGSGRYGGGPTVESTFRIDIDALRRDGLIRLGVRGGCVIQFSGPYRDLDVECETHIGGHWDDWVRLKYEMTDYWTGEPLAIDDNSAVCGGGLYALTSTGGCVRYACRSAAVTFGRGALMSLPTPPNERLSMTEPSGALASCA
jgi:hypothetical protein